MQAIWFILAIMTAGAVFALLWPLSRRPKAAEAGTMPAGPGMTTETGFYEDQLAEIDRDLARGLIAETEAEAARAEAARRLLRASRESAAHDGDEAAIAEPHLRQRRAAAAFALSTIPIVALLTYGLYGSPNLPSQTEADRQAVKQGGEDVMKAIAQVEAKLGSDPNDARGWMVIAPVYMRLGRYDDAARAYGQLVRIQGEDPVHLASWGEALVAAGEGNVSPEARKLFERALARDAQAAKPQFYLARADELAGDKAGAKRRLEALAAQGPADAPWMGLVQTNLKRLSDEVPPQAQAEPKPNPDKPPEGAAPPAQGIQGLPPAERMAAIRGMVEKLDQRLEAQGGSVEEWVRLVRSYGVLGDRDKALAALERGRTALASDAEGRARLESEAAAAGVTGDAHKGSSAIDPGAAGSGSYESPQAAAIRSLPPQERAAAIRGMVEGLDRRLAAKGGSIEEWMRLVRSYASLGEREAATGALDRAKMALAADSGAVGRLDALGRELDLRTAAKEP